MLRKDVLLSTPSANPRVCSEAHPFDASSASNLTDQTLYEIRTNSISTLTTLFLHSQQEAKKSEGERNCGKILKIRDELLFFSYRALVDPINLLPFSLGKELGDER